MLGGLRDGFGLVAEADVVGKVARQLLLAEQVARYVRVPPDGVAKGLSARGGVVRSPELHTVERSNTRASGSSGSGAST
jgi:hypothetical protein